MDAEERFFMDLVEDGTLSIDDQGRIWRHYWLHPVISKTRGYLRSERVKLRKPRRAETDKTRYLRLATFRNGKSIHVQAHRIVYIYFFGDVIDGLTIDHMNFDIHDNRPDNLKAVSSYENHLRSTLAGRRHVPHNMLAENRAKGEDDPKSKLTNEQARWVRANRGKMSQYKMAELLKVSRSAIQAILNGRTYKV